MDETEWSAPDESARMREDQRSGCDERERRSCRQPVAAAGINEFVAMWPGDDRRALIEHAAEVIAVLRAA